MIDLSDLSYSEACKLASNPYTKKEVLVALSDCDHRFVRYEVARNKSTPPNVLLKLAEDVEYLVCYVVAENPSSPTEAFDILYCNDESVHMLSHLAGNRLTPLHIIERLYLKQDLFINEILASNPNTPAKILLNLYKIDNNDIKRDVLNNPNCPAILKVFQ
jgi:hypothetical protein